MRQRSHPKRETVWQRMDKRIEEYHRMRVMREDPIKYKLVSQVDERTGQRLFHPKVISTRNGHTSYQAHTHDNILDSIMMQKAPAGIENSMRSHSPHGSYSGRVQVNRKPHQSQASLRNADGIMSPPSIAGGTSRRMLEVESPEGGQNHMQSPSDVNVNLDMNDLLGSGRKISSVATGAAPSVTMRAKSRSRSRKAREATENLYAYAKVRDQRKQQAVINSQRAYEERINNMS